MKKTTVRLLLTVLVIGALALLAGCGGEEPDDDAVGSTMRIAMQDVSYDASALTVTAGERARIDVENRGQVTHDFTIEEMPMRGLHMMGGAGGDEHMHNSDMFAMHLALEPQQHGTLEFEPTESGEYEFYCTVPGHREAGMRGVLTVR